MNTGVGGYYVYKENTHDTHTQKRMIIPGNNGILVLVIHSIDLFIHSFCIVNLKEKKEVMAPIMKSFYLLKT